MASGNSNNNDANPRGKPKNTALVRWLYDEGLSILKSDHDTRQHTHLRMDGGKFAIPPLRIAEFARYYAVSALILKERNYVSECRTNVFKLYIDLDLYADGPVDYETTIRRYISAIQEVIPQFLVQNTADELPLSPEMLHVLVLTAKPTECQKGGVSKTKTGVHLVWPQIHVNQSIALQLRHGLICFMLKTFEERMGTLENAWCDVIDESVYTSSGLRMIGSRKAQTCKVCDGHGFIRYPENECTECLGWGKIDLGRVYHLREVMNHKGELLLDDYVQKLRDDKPFRVLETSVRTLLESPNVHVVSVNPPWFDGRPAEVQIKRKKKSEYPFGHQRTQADKAGLATKESGPFTKLDRDIDDRYDAIVNCIHRIFPDCYKHVAISDILEYGEMGSLCHRYVARTNERYCLNIAATHTSNTIYFVIRPSGAVQKCFSLGRNPNHYYKFGSCESYESGLRPLTVRLKKKLFGDAAAAADYRNDGIVTPRSRTIKHPILRQKYERNSLFLKRLQDSLLKTREYEDKRFNRTEAGRRKAKRGSTRGKR